MNKMPEPIDFSKSAIEQLEQAEKWCTWASSGGIFGARGRLAICSMQTAGLAESVSKALHRELEEISLQNNP